MSTNTIRGIVIEVDGTTRLLDMRPGSTLKPLQEAVGGYIEAVYSADDTITFCRAMRKGKFTGCR